MKIKHHIKTLVALATLAPALALASGNGSRKIYEVKITNITKGQPITPPVVAVHTTRASLFTVGNPVSDGLRQLAEDGVTGALVSELSGNGAVVSTKTGSGVILPGKSETILVDVNKPNYVISVVAMLARTNDAIVAAKALRGNLSKNESYQAYATAYDAGTENNNESCKYIPAPPCGNANVRDTQGAEGFATFHPGIDGGADLIATRDAFAAQGALIEVKRVR